jgi:hypothetical protein
MPDIDDIFVPGTSNIDPPKGSPRKPSLDDIAEPGAGNPVFGGQVQTGLDQDDFRFQLKSNADNYKLRAQDQGAWETFGIKAANFIPNVLTGIGEMAGYAGAFVTEWGDDRDYSNKMTELMQSWKNPMGEVYRENPQQTFDLGDSAWWIDNIGSLMESATQFALPATGIGKLFGSLAKAAATGRKGLMVADGLAQTGTAASLAYMEGAMSGYRVYEQAYNTQLQKALDNGVDPQEAHETAKHIAADAASTTVQMNTVMNTMLNMTALAPMFKRSEDEVQQFLRAQKGLPGETGAAFKGRVTEAATAAGLFKNRKGITSLGSEAAQEGLEEVNTQYAESEGRRVGQGKKKDLVAALTDFDTAISDVANEEGALNFILGAFGGVAQTVMLDNIPVHSIKGPEGSKSKTLVSSRTLNNDRTRRYFDHMSEALAHDVGWQETKMAELAAATAKGDQVGAEIIRRDMFDVLGLSAVQMGMGEQWINTFEEMAATSNKVDDTDLKSQLDALNAQLTGDPQATAAINAQKNALIEQYGQRKSPAVEKGLAINAQDDSYKTRAKEAVADLKHYQKLHDKIYGKYNTAEEIQAGVADYIFTNEANLYRQERILAQETENLQRAKDENDLNFAGSSAHTVDMFNHAAAVYSDTMKLHGKIIERIKGDQAELNNALASGDTATIERILGKYRILGQIGTTQIQKMGEMMATQVDNATKVMKKAEEDLELSTGYSEWKLEPKNAKKSITDYSNFLGKKYGATAAIREHEAAIERLRSTVETNRARLREMTSDSANVKKVMTKLKEDKANIHKKVADRFKDSEVQRTLEQTAATAHVERNVTALQGQERMLHKQIKDIEEQIIKSTDQLRQREQRIHDLKLTQHSMWNVGWQVKMQVAIADAKALRREIMQLTQKREDLINQLGTNEQAQVAQTEPEVVPPPPEVVPEPEVVTPPPPPPVPTPDVTDPVVPAATRYLAELNRLAGVVHPAFAKAETDLKAGLPVHEDEFLATAIIADAIASNMVWRRSVTNVLTLLKQYVDLLPKPEVTQDEKVEETQEETQSPEERSAEEQWDEETAKEQLSAPTMGLPDSEVTTNGPDIVEAKDREHEGKKAVSAIKINNSTLEYVDFTNARGNYAMAGKKLNKTTPTDILDPNRLGAGTKVIVALDMAYFGKGRDYGRPNAEKPVSYSDFIDADGKVVDRDNVPIKISNEKGEVIGYLPTVSWVMERYPGTHPDGEGYRNIVATIEIDNGDGTVTLFDNLRHQVNQLRDLRRKIVDLSQVEVTIEQKGPGTVITNMTETADGTFRPVKGRAFSKGKPESSMLPDPWLNLGIIQNGVAFDGRNRPRTVNNKDLANYHNAPVAFLPMADGSYTTTPLYMPDLDGEATNNQAHATIERALWLYMKAGDTDVQAELDKMFALTGVNLRNPEELRDFINQQYTYTNKFDASNTALNPAGHQNFLFNITQPASGKATIMVGWQNSGQAPITANLVNGKIDPRFMAELRKGLATRTRNVNFTKDNIRGVNSEGQFKEHYFTGKEWKSTVYANYNEYVKTYAHTYAYGRNKQGDRYVYSANPMITLDVSSIKVKLDPSRPINPVLVDEPGPEQVPDSSQLSSDEAEELSGSLGMDFNFMPSIVTDMRPSEYMQLISINILQELYNFTPPSRRNGKTVEQVYEELLSAGVPYLTEGHNPFLNCT